MQRLTAEEFAQLANQDQDYYWFRPAYQSLSDAYHRGKMPHGLLLVAPELSAKAIFTAKLCKSLLCHSNSKMLGEYCNQCKACGLFDCATHPDIYYIDRELNKTGKLKQNIAIDQIRYLTDKLSSTAQLNGWRIGVIASVEKLSRGAFNALLKSLEEPGRQTLVILLVNQYYLVPQTIRSRCQKVTFNLTSQDLADWLQKHTQCDQNTANNALLHTENAPLAAKLFISSGAANDYQNLVADLDAVLSNEITAQRLFASHQHLNEALWRYIAHYFTQVELIHLSEAQSRYAKIPKTSVQDLYAQLLRYHQGQSQGSNLQFQLQIEAILTQWFEIGRKIVHYSKHTQ